MYKDIKYLKIFSKYQRSTIVSVERHIQHNLLHYHAYKYYIMFVSSNGTSMISLIIPPKDQISRVSKMLADEYGTASNIKSRVNRLSVLGAITSVQQRLKLYTKGDF